MLDHPNIVKLVGCMNRDRFFAAVIDDFPAMILGFIAAVRFSSFGEVASWTAGGICFFGYYFLSEVIFGNTFGKWCCDLRIRTLAGKKCRWWQMSIRSILRVLEVNPLLFGALPAGVALLLTPQRQRIGDLIAGTVVVRRAHVTHVN
jgi:uncharacterized RDD family membrane protein YckC